MNWKTFAAGAAAGFAAGYLVNEVYGHSGWASPEKVLATVKKEFGKSDSIKGSWIMMKPEKLEKNMLTYDVYKGGITKVLDDVTIQYEFIADASTGTILDLYETN